MSKETQMKNFVVITLDGSAIFVEASNAFEAAKLAVEAGEKPVMVREANV